MDTRGGFIGLGTMGMPMAANLAKAGVPLIVHDAAPAALAAASRLAGASAAGSPAEVAAQVDVLFTCLPNNDVVRGVYLEPGGIGAGAHSGLVTCDCSTVGPEVTVEISEGLRPRGIHHMD